MDYYQQLEKLHRENNLTAQTRAGRQATPEICRRHKVRCLKCGETKAIYGLKRICGTCQVHNDRFGVLAGMPYKIHVGAN